MPIRASRLLPGLVTATILSGCVTANVTTLDPRPHVEARTPPDSIVLYDTKQPECHYAELAQVSINPYYGATWGQVIKKLRQTASKIGGDAVIHMSEHSTVTSVTINAQQAQVNDHWWVDATVIRFDDPGCDR